MLSSIKYVVTCTFALCFMFAQQDTNATVDPDQRAISPTIQIRYDNFSNDDFTPSSAIGIKLRIDENRFTGFDVNSDSKETRIIMGWKWSILGLAVKEVQEGNETQNVNMYSFGVTYELLNGVNTIIEYVLSGDDQTDDFLRLSIGVEF